jgi:hypothetical protein
MINLKAALKRINQFLVLYSLDPTTQQTIRIMAEEIGVKRKDLYSFYYNSKKNFKKSQIVLIC